MYTNWDVIRRNQQAAAAAYERNRAALPPRRVPIPFETGDTWNPETLPVLDRAPEGFTRVQYWLPADEHARPRAGRYYALRNNAIEEYIRNK